MDKKILRQIMDVALSNGADFAEIFIEEKENLGISCEEKKIERINSGVDIGSGIRVIAGESTAYTFTNELTKDKLLKIAEVASKVTSGKEKNISLDFTTPHSKDKSDIKIRPDQVSIDDKINKIKMCDKACRAVDERITHVSVSYGDVKQKVTIANSQGVYIEDERIRTRFVCSAIAHDGDDVQTGFASLGATRGFEIFEDNDSKEIGIEAAKRAILMLSAHESPSGKMPIVMASEAGGTMVHEACGHGLEADLVQKGLSVYANKKGEKVAASIVTVIDDGTLAHQYGSYRYDDEGKESQKTVLIKDGILENYMYDYFTATKEDMKNTGNGRRQSYKEMPIPRMSNTYIASGEDDPEEIIKSTEYGLFVKKMGGGQVNTTNGDYVFDVAEGYLIQNGEITYPVKGATLTGNGPETLQMIEKVGNDLGFAIGTCGKEGQGVPVSHAQPTIKIKELIVGGTAIDKE